MSQERGKGGQKNQKHKKTNLLMFNTWQEELREKLKQSTNCVCWSEVNVNFCEKPDRCRLNGLPTYRIQLSTDGGRMGVFFGWHLALFACVSVCANVCRRGGDLGGKSGRSEREWKGGCLFIRQVSRGKIRIHDYREGKLSEVHLQLAVYACACSRACMAAWSYEEGGKTAHTS